MSRQLRIHVVGLLTVLLSGLAVVGVVVPACGFHAPNLEEVPSDAGMLFDSPPDVFIPDAAPCSSLIKTCVSGTVLRACQQVGVLPAETNCPWDCSEIPEPHCRVLMPSGGAVMATDLDSAMAMQMGLQKRSFRTLGAPGSINTDTGQIQIGLDFRQQGTGVRDGVDFQIRNGVGVFRFLELELKGFNDIRVTGTNALALVGIDKISISEGTKLDVRGTCAGRAAGPGGKQGGAPNTGGSGTGAGGAGDSSGVCSGGGGAGNANSGGNGGGRTNAGGTSGNSMTLTGGAGGGGGGSGGDGGGGGGAIQLVSNGPITLNAAAFQQVGINAGGCGGKAGACGGGAGAGGAILVEGRTVDFGSAFLAANGGGGGGAANGTSGQAAQVAARATGGMGAILVGPNNDGGDGGAGADDDSPAGSGTVRDQRGGGGGGGVGWIRIHTKSGGIGQSNTVLTPQPSTGMANVQ